MLDLEMLEDGGGLAPAAPRAHDVAALFYGAAFSALAFLPKAPDSPEAPFIGAAFNEEAAGHVLALCSLGISGRREGGGGDGDGGAAAAGGISLCSLDVVPLAAGLGACTALHACDWGEGDGTLVAVGGAAGGVAFLLLNTPHRVNSSPKDFSVSDSSLAELQAADGALPPRLPGLHAGRVACVDARRDCGAVLTAGPDGRIFVIDPSAAGGGGAPPAPFRDTAGGAAYNCARWVDAHTFVTTRPVGGLQLWDARAGPAAPAAAAAAPAEWGHTGVAALDGARGVWRQLTCCRVHPARPGLVATGASCGTVAVWDLRAAARPLAVTPAAPGGGAGRGAGDVTDLSFLGAGEGVVYCTADGTVAEAAPGEQPPLGAPAAAGWGLGSARTLAREPLGGFCALALGGHSGRDVLCAGDRENLSYIRWCGP